MFDEYVVREFPAFGGYITHYDFGAYGASVAQHMFSYGGEAGLFEVAVLDSHGNITYSTPVTDDVVGWLESEEVDELLARIKAMADSVKAEAKDRQYMPVTTATSVPYEAEDEFLQGRITSSALCTAIAAQPE